MKKNLLFVISQLYAGGAELSLVNLLKALSPEKYQVDLLVLYQDATSRATLLEEVPDWVRVCNATQKTGRDIFSRLRQRLLYTPYQRSCFPSAAMDFVANRVYDWAFHVGEWFAPVFVAEEVRAQQKALWLHTDINSAKNFDADGYFQYLEHFSRVIFVSRQSMENSCKKYPFLRSKAHVIYNISDTAGIREKAAADCEFPSDTDLPVVVTVANLRPEKNHLRQLHVMHALKQQGLTFQWWNIGAPAEPSCVAQVRQQAAAYGLENDFLLLGAKDNPYPYMKKADIVTCLSDYESWSMVISEAKVLGKAIVATKTSGALEQLTDGETGLLADFNTEAIADALKKALADPALRRHLEANIAGFDSTPAIVAAFDSLVDAPLPAPRKKQILYAIDNVNYRGGAHIATFHQISMLQQHAQVDVFTCTLPSAAVRCQLCNVNFYSWPSLLENRLYNRKILSCLLSKELSRRQKLQKMRMSRHAKFSRNPDPFGNFVWPGLESLFSQYETVCVMSEGSALKEAAANCSAANKIQWIHTDYCVWAQTPYGKERSKADAELWTRFSSIVVLSKQIGAKLAAMYPQFADKLVVIPNVMPAEQIQKKAVRAKKDFPAVHFVTVCRFEPVKDIPRLLGILRELYEEGYDFHWTFVGDGEDFEKCRSFVLASPLQNVVTFVGNTKNPYPYIKEADVMGLFSHYEGLPNTIFEALILGVPVCATNVGGVADQIRHGVTGWLTDDNEDAIRAGLINILEHPQQLEAAKSSLKTYRYDNAPIGDAVRRVFDV